MGSARRARIATVKVIPAMQQCEFGEIAAIASRDRAKAVGRARTRHSARLRFVRRVAGRSGHRCDLQSAAQPGACAVDDPRCGGKHVLCEKPIGLPSKKRAVDRRAKPLRQSGRRSVHGACPSAMGTRRELPATGRSGKCGRSARLAIRNRDPKNVRNVPIGRRRH